MHIGNEQTFQRHHSIHTPVVEFVLTAVVFSGMGAITWAIRGTAGWNGIDGTIIPGMTWGILWWYVCWRKGIDARGIPLWLGLGIALGGELGYGQYVSWIRGTFNTGDEVVSISPWTGYLWFAVCGVGWAAPGAIGLGWALAGRKSLGTWLSRLVVPVGIGIVARLMIQTWPWLFFPHWDLGIYVPKVAETVNPTGSDIQTNTIIMWLASTLLAGVAWATTRVFRTNWIARLICFGAVAVMAVLLLIAAQWLFFPGDRLGLFSGELGRHAGRTVYTNSQNAIVVGWWIGALLVACIQRDRFTIFAGLTIGAGFGIGFPLSAVWCLGYLHAPDLVDWWKMWELQAGLHLGLLYVVVLYWAIRQTHNHRTTASYQHLSISQQWCETLTTAIGVLLLIHVASREDFLVVGILLGLTFVAAIVTATVVTSDVAARRRAVSFAYSVFLLVFIMTWGASSQTGILLGLYGAEDVDQYAWPAARVMIFVPAGILIVGSFLVTFYHSLRKPFPADTDPAIVSSRIVNLITFTGLVGAATIWPSKIGAFYACCIGTALFAFNRLNHYFDHVDRTPT